MQIIKTIQEIGNGAHIYMPKEMVGRRVTVNLLEKSIEDVKNEIVELLKPHLKHICGIYLCGSYARKEQEPDSDIDVLVITDGKIKIEKKMYEYQITSGTIQQIENTLNNNSVLILPIVKECKAIINGELVTKYRTYKLTKKNTRWYIDTTVSSLKIIKGLIEEKDIKGMPNLVYPLMMRIRGLYLIKSIVNNRKYSNREFRKYLVKNRLSRDVVMQLYRMYREQRDDKRISAHTLNYNNVEKLYSIAKKLLAEVKGIWERQK